MSKGVYNFMVLDPYCQIIFLQSIRRVSDVGGILCLAFRYLFNIEKLETHDGKMLLEYINWGKKPKGW